MVDIDFNEIFNNDEFDTNGFEYEYEHDENPILDDFSYEDEMGKWEKLSEIYESKGFDKVLGELMLASIDLVGNATVYNVDKSNENKTHIIKNIGVIYSIIETLIAGDEGVARAVGLLKDTYIDMEHEEAQSSVGPTQPGFMYESDEEEIIENEEPVNKEYQYNVNRIKHLFEE